MAGGLTSSLSQSASRQGNRLHMNVYETRGQPARVSTTKASGAEPKRGFRPPQHCPTLAQVVSRKVQAAVPEQGMVRPRHWAPHPHRICCQQRDKVPEWQIVALRVK